MDNKKIIAPQVPKIEEVREIENTEQGLKKLEEKQKNRSVITENLKEAVVPTIHASDDEEKAKKAAAEGVIGGAIATASVVPSPIQPIAAGTALGENVVGKGVEKIGEMTDEEGVKEIGKSSKEIGEIGSLPSVVKGGISGLKKLGGGS